MNEDQEYKPAIQISLNKEGNPKLDTAPLAKEVIVNLLAEALKLIAMKPDNVTQVPKNMSPKNVKNWINRKMSNKRR